MGASAIADHATRQSPSPQGVSALRAGIVGAVTRAFSNALGYIWRDFDEHMARQFVEALHEQGFAIVEMGASPQVSVSSVEFSPYQRAVRARVGLDAGVLGGQHIVPEEMLRDEDFCRRHLPHILAREITGVLERDIAERIAQGMPLREDSEAG